MKFYFKFFSKSSKHLNMPQNDIWQSFEISRQRFGHVCGCVSLRNTLKFQPNFYYPVLQISISRVCNHTPRHLHDQEEEHQQNLAGKPTEMAPKTLSCVKKTLC